MELVEHIQTTRVNGVKLLRRDSSIATEGSLSIDVFFLIFSSKNPSKDEVDVITVRERTAGSNFGEKRLCNPHLQLLHTSVYYIDHKPPSLTVSLYLKDFRTFDFEFQQLDHCQGVVSSLQPLSKPGTCIRGASSLRSCLAYTAPRSPLAVHQLYAFNYMPRQTPSLSTDFSSWQYDPPDTWRVSKVNKDFKVP